MEHQIKQIVEACSHAKTQKLIENHLVEILLHDQHLVLLIDNAAPLHELSQEENDEHLKKALEAVFGEDLTYELKLAHTKGVHERELEVPHNINY